jgi:small subunit ribosomal protein S5
MSDRNRRDDRDEGDGIQERVVSIDRVAKVAKGGRRFGFRVLVVVGDGAGRVGVGVGKSRDVPSAIRKAVERGKSDMITIPLFGRTIPHDITVRYGAAKVMLKPASPGTGVIAGGGVRAVVEAAGIHDVLSKSMGSDNSFNVVMATFKALQELTDFGERAEMRGKTMEELLPPWRKVATNGE